MKLIPPITKALILSGMIFLLLGATKDDAIHITPGQPVVPESPLFATSAAKIKVYNFLDGRPGMLDPYMIGHVTGPYGKSMDNLYSDRPVFEIVTEAVKSELIRKGYRIFQENEDFSVKGRVVQFWAKRIFIYRVTSNWDVEGEVSLTLEVSRPGQKVISTLGPYNGRKFESIKALFATRERTKLVLEGALMDAIQQMSADPNLTKALSKKP